MGLGLPYEGTGGTSSAGREKLANQSLPFLAVPVSPWQRQLLREFSIEIPQFLEAGPVRSFWSGPSFRLRALESVIFSNERFQGSCSFEASSLTHPWIVLCG